MLCFDLRKLCARGPFRPKLCAGASFGGSLLPLQSVEKQDVHRNYLGSVALHVLAGMPFDSEIKFDSNTEYY